MSEDSNQTEVQQFKQRGPSFPFIGLEKAVERTKELYAKAKRFDVRLSDAAADWKYGAKSSGAFQTAAALLAYGLIEDSGSGEGRKLRVSELGYRVIADERPGMREKHLAEAARRPKLIAEFADRWRDGRPDDSHAISDLKFDHGFTDESAPRFLRVFDDAFRFMSPKNSDFEAEFSGHQEDSGSHISVRTEGYAGLTNSLEGRANSNRPPTALLNERELTTGMLSKRAGFRLLVSGEVGVKEIERLIRKLELDKEILADTEDNALDEDQGIFG